jgi:hypothetical protein
LAISEAASATYLRIVPDFIDLQRSECPIPRWTTNIAMSPNISKRVWWRKMPGKEIYMKMAGPV